MWYGYFRGWVDDIEDAGVLAISRRVAAMTGLDISMAEPFQVSNLAFLRKRHAVCSFSIHYLIRYLH